MLIDNDNLKTVMTVLKNIQPLHFVHHPVFEARISDRPGSANYRTGLSGAVCHKAVGTPCEYFCHTPA
jgi:hypothetical protein